MISGGWYAQNVPSCFDIFKKIVSVHSFLFTLICFNLVSITLT